MMTFCVRPALFVCCAAITLFASNFVSAAQLDVAPRERLLMDFGWRFHLGNEWGSAQSLAKAGSGAGPASASYSDAGWRRIDLPHDWAIELPFDPKAEASHGFKPLGAAYPQNSVAWYRRTFDLPAADAGRRLSLEFDGAFRDCTVFVNGWFVGHHEGGYNGFRFDITDVVNCGGTNVVAVKVDATETEGWFYEGAGIYRHVWLTKTAPVAIAPDGVFVFSRFKDNVPAGPAAIELQTRLANVLETASDVVVRWEILGPDGKSVAKVQQPVRVEGAATAEARQTAAVPVPVLWSPESPRLYTLVTTVAQGDVTVDRMETTFGIRTVAFDANRGFLLNGKPYEIKGTCNHQDHAGVGAALEDRLNYFRIAKLKEMGANAYRSAHNEPTPELLDACDHLGMLVMDENRLFGSDAANEERLASHITRDRNHPSVVIWSIANEEFDTGGTPAGRRVAASMQALINRLDPTRAVTYNAPVGNEFPGVNEVIEVRGWSYRIGPGNMDAYHAAHPTQPNVGSEQGSTVSTRGIYANDAKRGYVSAYDDNAPDWGNTAEQWWSFFATHPWLSGGFVWTGFDYRGEPTPYEWPCISSHFGILDTCGFPKDNFWYYQSWWTDKPVLHLLPHWNWRGREGQEIDVRALSNCDEVELFLNGRSLGRQSMKPDSQLAWKVAYAPGTLSAQGFKSGRLVAETKVETTGAPTAIRLTPDRTTINGDGEDLAIYTVSIVDQNGRVVPDAGNKVTFELDGPGRIVGVGNGDPSCHEPDVVFGIATSRTSPVEGWRWKKIADPYIANLPEAGDHFDDSAWSEIDVTKDKGPLGLRERAVYRTHLFVTQSMLTAAAVELRFGEIAGGVAVFLNGEKLGPGGDSRYPSIFDVSKRLHVGDNKIAVTVANYWGTSGICKGVMLRFWDNPPAPVWQRSVFNGLGQVIVRAAKGSGPITLDATADGLEPASVSVEAQPAAVRPVVP